ncbi:MAG: rhodanese-related sulfurtransferase [Lentisphaerae bacterium]|nr:rhodanese-related sulfurtransferase [Lentisphaerota bacterium]
MTQPIVVSALYHFVPFENYAAFRQPLLDLMHAEGIRGTLLLASEGINGTIAGRPESVERLLSWLKTQEPFASLRHEESHCDDMPFLRAKVRLKKEIVTMGVEGVDPLHAVGTYVDPEEWNALIEDPEVLVLDTRNEYEVAVGTFERAVNPHTQAFREFPAYVKDNLDPARHKKVAMFCTGGIRCEKSTAYLKEQGFDEVYHLRGGILKYLEIVPEAESKWQGECFVFDSRVTVTCGLKPGQYDSCYACRMPISVEEKARPEYEHGVSCPHCYDSVTHEQRQRFIERERQVKLATSRGEAHIGADVQEASQRRRVRKASKRAAQMPLAAPEDPENASDPCHQQRSADD